jgi:predicted LPLAT superfamily acyltransferase
MAKHGRALVLTAHLGNWELLALAHRLTGIPTTVVMRALDAAWLDVMADRLRRWSGIELVEKRAALRPVLGALNRGRMVALLLDQNASRREGVFVSFRPTAGLLEPCRAGGVRERRSCRSSSTGSESTSTGRDPAIFQDRRTG